MRIALTIVLNGEMHLLNWGRENCHNFDHWIIVEGAVHPKQCTAWCNKIPEDYLKGCHSSDYTLQVISQLKEEFGNITILTKEDFWDGKLEMFQAMNPYIERLKPDYIWQVDVDEYWTKEDLESAETNLAKSDAICSRFLTDTILYANNEYVLQVFGEWGEGKDNNFKRLWKYEPGCFFERHEPPMMSHENGKERGWAQNSERPLHLSYFYEEDVKFKSEFYKEHEFCYEGWKTLVKMSKGNMPILNASSLFKNKGKGLYMKNTFIKKAEAKGLKEKYHSVFL